MAMRLTVRGIEPRLERELKRLAKQSGPSLSKAALELMRRGAGLPAAARGKAPRIGAAIDRFVGTLSREDAEALERANEQFEVLDEE